ncbi:1-aminocyclopropane-1-carboxylate synthase-like protein 1 isoform X2 [Brachionichthys hirsutus]|uniref:1-aminocyclopropane-1-carboxylate synthase-like protein 1 isoform X2 n=1 Tax=Brachionichthys hirsutus TaxID=412623 RepID=UPI003604F371
MDFRGRRHERGSNWTDPEIVELLQLWSDESVQVELESSLRNQRVFDRIAHVLRERGIYRTGDQCREKIKKMKLEYRRIKDNHKMRSWKFYDVMDRVLANRPAVTYSSLGGAVIAQQQVLQNQGPPDAFLQGGGPASSFGPFSSGGFLFGQPPKTGDLLDIKCEDVGESLPNSGAAPEMYYGSGDEQEAAGPSLLGPGEASARGESSTTARISPSAFSDLNLADSATASTQDTSEQPRKGRWNRFASARQRKHHQGGKTAWSRRGVKCCSQGRLDKALASFLTWQQSAEERLLSLEEARLERELQTEEQREQREERRAERERRHELHLFSMLTEALAAVRRGAPTAVKAQPDPSFSSPPLSPSSAPDANPSLSSFFSQPPSAVVAAEATSNQESLKAVACTPVGQKSSEAMGDAEPAGPGGYLSNRGNGILRQERILQQGFSVYDKDRYHSTENAEGIINLGTSENKLCYDLLHKRLTKPDMLHVEPCLLEYGDWRGQLFLREEVAKFLTYYCCSPNQLKAENVVVVNGCSSLFSCIAAVICDPEDALLISTPFYGAVTPDVRLYSGVRLFHIPLDSETDGKGIGPFHLTVSKLEEGLKRAKREGLTVRGLVLLNPHNPLADIYTQEEMAGFLEFAKRHELHVIVDEVYMLSVFDDSVTFHSVLNMESLPDPQRTHVIWGLSKDFAMSAIRVGTLYTENKRVVEAIDCLGIFHGIPGTTQHQVAQLFKDREWIDKVFLPENRSRLKAAHSYLTGELKSMGVPFLNRPAALYVWADLRKYLREPSFEEELSLWKCFIRHKVIVSCGQAFYCSTPGWFRFIFAIQQDHLQLGLKRIRETLKETEDSIKEHRKSVKANSGDSDNAMVVNSKSSPASKSSDQLTEKDNIVPDTASVTTEEFVLLSNQVAKPTESMESLVGILRNQIRSSDWLEQNTPELPGGEDPEILDVFKDLLQRAAK